MSYGSEYHNCCTKCCTVTPLFWVYMLGLAGTFASLFFFFWQYPGTLTQFSGPREEAYNFVDNGNNTLSIYRDNVLITSGIAMSSDGIDLTDLRRASCGGTSLLWTMLISGFLSVLWLLWWFVDCPNRFICCNLQQPYADLQRQCSRSASSGLTPMVSVPLKASTPMVVTTPAPAPTSAPVTNPAPKQV